MLVIMQKIAMSQLYLHKTYHRGLIKKRYLEARRQVGSKISKHRVRTVQISANEPRFINTRECTASSPTQP